MTERESYLAMFAFLEAHYRRTRSEDVGALLGDLSLLPSGSPADPAVTFEWEAAVALAKTGEVRAQMELQG